MDNFKKPLILERNNKKATDEQLEKALKQALQDKELVRALKKLAKE